MFGLGHLIVKRLRRDDDLDSLRSASRNELKSAGVSRSSYDTQSAVDVDLLDFSVVLYNLSTDSCPHTNALIRDPLTHKQFLSTH